MNVNEKDYTYYFELAKGLKDNNLSKKYSELEPYKDNLKILLSEIYDIEFALKVYYEHSKEYIDNCIIFCKSLGNKKLDPENLNIIRKNHSLIVDSRKLLECLICLYTPETKIYDLSAYLVNIRNIFMYGDRYWMNNKIDTKNPLMDEVFTCFKRIRETKPRSYDYDLHVHHHNQVIIVTIIGALNYYKNNDNLESFTYYMDHLDDVLDILNMNGIYESDINMYSDPKLKYMFDNFESLFGKKNMLIK